MSASEPIHTTQQLANAAEAFLDALGIVFSSETFKQFFHSDTLRRAYWSALQQALSDFATPENMILAQGLMNGQVLADLQIVDEMLKLFLPDQEPDYAKVAARWASVLPTPPETPAMLIDSAQTLFNLLADELRQSADLRHALDQLAQTRYAGPDERSDSLSTAEQDLNRLLDAALIAGPSTLQLQVRHLLMLASWKKSDSTMAAVPALMHVVGHLAADALQKVWEQVDQVVDPALRLRLLGQLAPHLCHQNLFADPLALVLKTITNSASSLDPALCVDVLLELAPHLDTSDKDSAFPPFRQRLLEGVQAINDPASRVRALGALIEHLPPVLQSEAVEMAFDVAVHYIENETVRAAALSDLPSHLPQKFHAHLIEIAYEIETPDARARLLGRMIPYVSPALRPQALIDALHAIEQIMGDDARTTALIALASSIEAIGLLPNTPAELQKILGVLFSVEYANDRARAFVALAPYLSVELLGEALYVLRDIESDHDRALTLTKLAPHLPDDLQVAAFAIAQEIQPPGARSQALAAVAPYLSATARAQALVDALAAALSIERYYERVMALTDLAPHLPKNLQDSALQEALTATRLIADESERGRALIFLAPYLHSEHMADAMVDAYRLHEPVERASVLSALVPYLPIASQLRVGQDVIKLAHEAKPAHHKASILASIAPVLPNELFEHAVTATAQITMPYDRMHVLTMLLLRQPRQLYDVALEVAHAVPNRNQRVNALLELIPHTSPELRQPVLDEVLETALGITDDYDRASAFAHLAPYSDVQTEARNRQQDALSFVLTICLDVTESETRAALLSRLAAVWVRLLSPGQSYPLWRQAVKFLRTCSYTEVLSDLAALTLVIDLMGMSDVSDDIAGSVLQQVFER